MPRRLLGSTDGRETIHNLGFFRRHAESRAEAYLRGAC